MATTVLAFISEVAEITGRRLVLRFDAGEVLADADFALLGELASRGIDAFLLLVTVNAQHPGIAPKLAILEARGATRHDLSPLVTEEINEWLRDASVPEEVWPTIIRESAGYPFFIDELIVLYGLGRLGDVVNAPSGFNRLLRETWSTLDRQQQVIATTLSCFPEPPAPAFISEHLGMSPIEWTTARLALRDSRVFVTRPDGIIWFHDRRRDFIWRELLDADARAAVADAASVALRTVVEKTNSIFVWVLVAIPGLLRAGAPSVTADPYMSQISQLSHDELAIMFSLIELTDTTSPNGPAVDTTAVGRFALSRLDLPQDPIAALESLAHRGFLLSQSNQRVSVTIGIFPSTFAFIALVAQISESFRRTPIPRLGTATFDRFIRPLIGDFDLASISVGQGSRRTHRDSFDALRKANLGERDIGTSPTLGIDYLVGPQPITTTVVFKSVHDRDLAEVALRQHEPDSGVDAVHIETIDRLPPARIRLARVARALTEFADNPTSSSILEHARHRTRIMEAVRRTLNPDEASAINWVEPRSLLLDIADAGGSWAEVRLRGGDEAAVTEIILPEGAGLLADPLIELKLRREGQIDNNHTMDGWSIHSRSTLSERKSALQEVLDELKKRTQAFNRGLAAVPVPVDPSALEDLIREERRAGRDLLDAIVNTGLTKSMPADDDSSVHVFLYLHDDEEVFFEGWMASAIHADDHQNNVTVQFLRPGQPHPSFMTTADELEQFGLPPRDTLKAVENGDAESVLAPLLGWDREDVRLARPPAQLNRHPTSKAGN